MQMTNRLENYRKTVRIKFSRKAEGGGVKATGE